MSEENNPSFVQPAKLKAMKKEEVLARAQAIANKRGRPPYSQDTFAKREGKVLIEFLLDEEVEVLSEFVQYWEPYLTFPSNV